MKNILIFIVKVYKQAVSPHAERLFGNACRFTPSCSEYTIEALEKFGAMKGLIMGLSRLAKCHPFGGFGYDPID